MALTALAVLGGDALRHDGPALLESLAHLTQRRRVQAELLLQIFDAAGPGALEMSHETRALIVAALCFLERRAAQRVDRARPLRREEQRLSAVQLGLVDAIALRQLPTPRPLRLGPRGEARLRGIEGLLMRCREQRWQAAVLRQGEDLALREEGKGVVQRPQLPLRSKPAVVEPACAELD